ncbi:ABC transporter transmembrane domain-containing protein, partial [uncultured Georgenia sp.]|uniref:ABC transporter transmembrane domain-containing protein n=1 Tax=uncultured Georgenia sp. TaxID=378209 RepID=UPI0026165E52
MLDVPTGHPGHPPLHSPMAYLTWVGRRGRRVLLPAAVLTTAVSLAGAAVPLLLGLALDTGLAEGVSARLLWLALVIVAVGVFGAVTTSVGHAAEVGGWMHGSFTTTRLVGHHVSRTGPAIGEELPTGEVVSAVANDSFQVGNVLELLPAFVGGLVGYLAVTGYMLRQSPSLGVVVALGLPVVTVVVSFLIRPLQARQKAQRDAAGRLATLATDTVSGLRILRGIGG